MLRLISTWRTYSEHELKSSLHQTMFFSLLVLSVVFMPEAWSQGKSPQQLTFSISAQEGSCDRSVALYQGERITLKFPQKVQVSVPGHDRLVKLFISGRLVVVTPLSQQPPGRSRSGFPAVSVTTELVSGETFICRFDILPRVNLREGDQPVELIRVISVQEERRREDEAITLIQSRLQRLRQNYPESQVDSHQYSRLDQLLQHWQKQVSQDAIHKVFGSPHLILSSPTPLRAQEHLIYITIERVMVSNDLVYLRIGLRNHSQERFVLHRIFYIPPDEKRAMTLWTPSHLPDGATISAPPNGQEKLLVLTAPLHILQSQKLVFEGEDRRNISIDISAINELQ